MSEIIPAQRAVEKLAWKLRRRQIAGARQTALETLLVLRQVVAKSRFSSIEQLISTIKTVGRRLLEAQPREYTTGNTIRKILHQIREEYQSIAQPDEEEFTIAKFVAQGQPRTVAKPTPAKQRNAIESDEDEDDSNVDDEDEDEDPDAFSKHMKPIIVEAIQDALYELETVYDNISKNAKDHVHSDEIILTLGPSKTVMSFLKSASHTRNYSLLIASPSPASGAEFAQSLTTSIPQNNLPQIYLVPFSSIHTLISRVNKLLLSAHAILANGGIFTQSGGKLATESARIHSVNVVVVAGQFKITPILHRDFYGSLDFGNPDMKGVFGMQDGDLVDKVDVVNPYFDYVGPECIDVFITNDGDVPPSSIYRLLKETYDDEDTEL